MNSTDTSGRYVVCPERASQPATTDTSGGSHDDGVCVGTRADRVDLEDGAGTCVRKPKIAFVCNNIYPILKHERHR